MKTIVDINQFCKICGYSFDASEEQGFWRNNGYNCNHGEQEEAEVNPDTGKKVGNCFTWSCPLAPEASKGDFTSSDIDNQGYKYEEMRYVVVDKEES